MERGSIVFEEQIVQDEELWHDDDSADRDGWFCVRTDPFPCPAAGLHVRRDVHDRGAPDPLLAGERRPEPAASRARARDVGRNPRIVGYQSDYGPSASYYAWIAAGRPVHGIRAQ